jgi:Sigma-70, region 4
MDRDFVMMGLGGDCSGGGVIGVGGCEMSRQSSEKRADFILCLRRHGYTQRQLAERFGVSQARIHQIEAMAKRNEAGRLQWAGQHLAVVEHAALRWPHSEWDKAAIAPTPAPVGLRPNPVK